jgi:MobA-like NTP transferase domain
MNCEAAAPALLVLAAGGGRRYGGLKQLAPVGPQGESIMEYSIHDALAAGFTKIVLVVRREQERAFRDKFVARIENRVEIELAYQEMRAGPARAILALREKPWGTAHAVLSAQHLIHTPFAVLNADDFYGPTAIAMLGAYLRKMTPARPLSGALVGYPLGNTLSDHGAVSRGICQLNHDHTLAKIVERHEIRRDENGGSFLDEHGNQRRLSGYEIVSMNLWGFPSELFERWQQHFREFIESGPSGDVEFEIPSNVGRMMEADELRVQVLETDEPWCGLTYRDDLPRVRKRIAALVERGTYPPRLWERS